MADAVFLAMAHGERPYAPDLLAAIAAGSLDGSGMTWIPEVGAAETRTWAELWDVARQVGGGLRARGVQRGDRVLIVLDAGFGFVEALLGAMSIGAVPVPAYPPMAMERTAMGIERLIRLIQDATPVIAITELALLPFAVGLLAVCPTIRDIQDPAALRGERVEPVLGPIALLQYTSGSTGQPKGVVVTHENLAWNMHGSGTAVGVVPSDVLVTWLPMYHDLGLVAALLASLWWRIPLVAMSPVAFLQRPARWLHAIAKYRGTISQAPNFAYARCAAKVRDADIAGIDLSCWRVAASAAEPVHKATMDAFAARFRGNGFDPRAFGVGYGLAEGVAACVMTPRPGEGIAYDAVDRHTLARGYAEPSTAADAQWIASCGTGLVGVEISVVDPAGSACAERVVGAVRLRGPSITTAYFHRADGPWVDGWLSTGDLGYFANGELYVCGREKEMIKVRGRGYWPDDLEVAAETVPGVRPGRAVAFGTMDDSTGVERVIVVCEVEGTEDLVGPVADAIRERTGLSPDAVIAVLPGTIPKTSSGKRQRIELRRRWLAGDLAG